MQQKFWRISSLIAITSGLFALAFAITAFSPFPQASLFKSLQKSPDSSLGEMAAFQVHGQLQITPEIQSEKSVVRVVVFWMNGCPHCHEVLEDVLPALQEKYGAQLEILLLEVVSMDDVNRLFEVAALYDIPREQAVVPFMVIGDRALIGSRQIPEELPNLIDSYLAQGGVDWPLIPNLIEYLAPVTPNQTAAPKLAGSTVQVVLFTTLDCRECQLTTAPVLRQLKEQYENRFEVKTIDVVSSADVDYLYQVAGKYGFPEEAVDLPLLILGGEVLMKEEIPARLPELVDEYLQGGGASFPILPAPIDMAAAPSPTFMPAEATASASPEIHSNGFSIAIFTMGIMMAALIYSVVAFALGKAFSLPDWTVWLTPILIAIGLGVAGYLAYVETQLIQAACGPVGDCNAVQSSPYARLFGILPVGVLGVIGYLAILAAWFYPRVWRNRIAAYLPILVFSMAFFGVLFSLYLTFLEPFVIKAVCMWCITSAVIMTLLLLSSVMPAIQTVQSLQETDLSHANIELETPS